MTHDSSNLAQCSLSTTNRRQLPGNYSWLPSYIWTIAIRLSRWVSIKARYLFKDHLSLRYRQAFALPISGMIRGDQVRAIIARVPFCARAILAAVVAAFVMLGTACTSSHDATSRQSTPAGTSSAASSASAIAKPAATKPVQPPTTGNISQTVLPGKAKVLSPVTMSATAIFGDGVTANVINRRTVTVKATMPHEISGAAAVVTIRISNGSHALNLGNVVVTAEDAAGTPLVEMRSGPSAPLSGSAASDKNATGVYVFKLPTNFRSPLRVSVSYSTTAPVAVFVGGVK